MTTLKLENRKNTTGKALEALETLVESFKFSGDIDKIESLAFDCAGNIGDNGHNVYGDLAFWSLDNGELTLQGILSEYGGDCSTELWLAQIKKINFKMAISTLSDLIKEYNTKCAEKDAQIEEFLNFCAEYNKK